MFDEAKHGAAKEKREASADRRADREDARAERHFLAWEQIGDE